MSELLYLITSLAAYEARNALNKQFPSSRLKLITSESLYCTQAARNKL